MMDNEAAVRPIEIRLALVEHGTTEVSVGCLLAAGRSAVVAVGDQIPFFDPRGPVNGTGEVMAVRPGAGMFTMRIDSTDHATNPCAEVEYRAVVSEYDLLELLSFKQKASWEGWSYAFENWPPRLEKDGLAPSRDEAAFRSLLSANDGRMLNWWASHTEDGVDLLNAHVDESRRRVEEMCRWAVRFANGNISTCETEAAAWQLADSPSWQVEAVLRRDDATSPWVLAPGRGQGEAAAL